MNACDIAVKFIISKAFVKVQKAWIEMINFGSQFWRFIFRAIPFLTTEISREVSPHESVFSMIETVTRIMLVCF